MVDPYANIRKALAMEPTPGPWEVVGLDGGYGGPYALRMPHRSGRTWYGVEGIKRREDAEYFVACDPDTIRALLEERDGLTAENARLREALHVVSECGDPCKVILYDEEGIEGWRWTHPDGREWTETGEWSKGPPLHPVARAALAQEDEQ